MASFVFVDPTVIFASSTISEYVTAAEVRINLPEVTNVTEFEAEWLTWSSGRTKTWSVTLSLNQDFAAGAIDSILWPHIGGLTTIAVRATADPVSVDNPQYQGNCILLDYTPFNAAVGDLATGDIVLRGTGELSRVVIP